MKGRPVGFCITHIRRRELESVARSECEAMAIF
jgi:hypothetical protein